MNILKALTCALKKKIDLTLHMMFGSGMATSEHISRDNYFNSISKMSEMLLLGTEDHVTDAI